MPTPTTMRAELLKAVETFNDRFFLTLGDTGAGMNPYNPIQPGLGARLILQTDRNVQDVSMTLRRVGDSADIQAGSLNPVKTSETTWEVEGAIGGARLGFPQPAPSYHVPQCFELTVVARNRRKVDRKVYTFWVGEGIVGTIAKCIDRLVIGTKPLIAGYDSLGWHEYAFPDNYAEFFARNGDPAFTADDEDLYGLLPDPLQGVYVEGAPSFFPSHVTPEPNNPFARLPEPSPIILPTDPNEALKAAYGDQWKYRAIDENEVWQHGTLEKAPRGAPAAVHPTLGTGVSNKLVANPQVGNDIGGAPTGPNVGFPRGLDGVRIEYVSGEDWGTTGSDDFVFDLVLDDWAPADGNGTTGYHLLVGLASNWVTRQGGFIELQSTQPAHLMCAVDIGRPYYDALDLVAWPAANTLGSTIGVSKNATHRITLRKSTSGVGGVYPPGTVLVVQAVAHIPGIISVGGTGYFGRLFPVETMRSNALRINVVA